MDSESIFPDMDVPYILEDIPGDGDCFYHCLARCLSSIGLVKTVTDLRREAHDIISTEKAIEVTLIIATNQTSRRTERTYLQHMLKGDYADELVIVSLLHKYRNDIQVLIVDDPYTDEVELPRKPTGEPPNKRSRSSFEKNSSVTTWYITLRRDVENLAVFVRRGDHYQIVLLSPENDVLCSRVVKSESLPAIVLLDSWNSQFIS